MTNKIKRWWQRFILEQFHKHYQIGGHCGLCGKWIDVDIVSRQGAITACVECLSGDE